MFPSHRFILRQQFQRYQFTVTKPSSHDPLRFVLFIMYLKTPNPQVALCALRMTLLTDMALAIEDGARAKAGVLSVAVTIRAPQAHHPPSTTVADC